MRALRNEGGKVVGRRGLAAAAAAVLILAIPPVAAAADTSGASGAASCEKPPVPPCIDDTTTFVSADKMIACQSAVKIYIDETMTFLSCLKDDHLAIGEELTRNVNRFNCRLGGRPDCW